VAPIASGATLRRAHRAFADLAAARLIDGDEVRVSVTQPMGCAPVAEAFARGDRTVAPVRASTEVHSLAMGDPPDGDDLLAALGATGGAAVAVEERTVSRGVDLLRDTVGIDGEPAVGVAVEGLRLLVEGGVVRPGECVVLHIGAARPPAVGNVRATPGVSIAATLDGLSAVLPEHLREGRS
jgi:threonine synthase